MCDIAKGLRATSDRRARAELKEHAGVPFYLGLLAVVYWQEHALDALLVWLQHEPAHVAQYMEQPAGLQQLQAARVRVRVRARVRDGLQTLSEA